MYKNNKLVLLLLMALVIGITLFIVRLIIGGDEDTWICENGSWVVHGNPAGLKPNTQCVSEK